MKTCLTFCFITLNAATLFAQSNRSYVDLAALAKAQKLQVFNRAVTPLTEGEKKGRSGLFPAF